jgi:hypothetical protein
VQTPRGRAPCSRRARKLELLASVAGFSNPSELRRPPCSLPLHPLRARE